MHAPPVAVAARTHCSDGLARGEDLPGRHRSVDRLDRRDQTVRVHDAHHGPVDHPARERHGTRSDGDHGLPGRCGEVDPAVPGGVAVRWRAPRLHDGEARDGGGPPRVGPAGGRGAGGRGAERRPDEQSGEGEHARAQESGSEHAATLLEPVRDRWSAERIRGGERDGPGCGGRTSAGGERNPSRRCRGEE